MIGHRLPVLRRTRAHELERRYCWCVPTLDTQWVVRFISKKHIVMRQQLLSVSAVLTRQCAQKRVSTNVYFSLQRATELGIINYLERWVLIWGLRLICRGLLCFLRDMAVPCSLVYGSEVRGPRRASSGDTQIDLRPELSAWHALWYQPSELPVAAWAASYDTFLSCFPDERSYFPRVLGASAVWQSSEIFNSVFVNTTVS